MRIVCISDTHERLNKVDVPDGDVLIHAGDGTIEGTKLSILTWGRDLRALPHKHKIIIAGNHDILFQNDLAQAIDLLGGGIVYLEDSSVKLDGVTFYGSPWTPPFGTGWAFNGPPPRPNCVPDVLITHGPPFGVMDVPVRNPSLHVGCKVWAQRLNFNRPKLHVFGHIHEGYGRVDHGGCTFVNASVLNEKYQLANAPIVVDL